MKLKKKTCTGLIQACIYMMRPEIITGTFQMALDAPPLLCSHEPEHVSTRCEQRYIPPLMTQSPTVGSTERWNSYRCCYMYGGVSRMSICPTSRLVLWVTICVLLCYIKAWGLYDQITVHFPCSLCIFFCFVFWKRGLCWQGFHPWASFVAVFQKKTEKVWSAAWNVLWKKMNRCL